MGKRRRAAKKVVKKVRQVVATVFKCPFCNHVKAVTCKLDTRSMTGALECTVCGVKWETAIHSLTGEQEKRTTQCMSSLFYTTISYTIYHLPSTIRHHL
jgi:transcription elongation factor Elf1